MNRTQTENGADTFVSSGNALVDFFALAGATRKNPQLGLELFLNAYATDKQSAVRVLFYLRDVRGGQGERNLFRTVLAYLKDNDPEVAEKLSKYVPEYGRYDDLYALGWDIVLPIVKEQLEKDKASETPSLLAKWLPSENTSSKMARHAAVELADKLGLTRKDYRKLLSTLRKKIRIIETPITKREYAVIDYDKIPSQAGLKYRKAFDRNDHERYTAFRESVQKGEKTINTKTLYPYQVYKVAHEVGAEEMWQNLPDYTDGKNAIVVADVSGSMYGDPISVAVSLAIYFAERNIGQFKDNFITFSARPQLQTLQGKTLADKIHCLQRQPWDMNTDLYAVFKLLVDTAVKTKAPVSEMPETIYIISDMEFDEAVEGETNFEAIDKLYAATDYKRPSLVFWNVDARQKQVPVSHDTNGVTLVSGLSASTFKLAVEGKTPLELVEEVINSPRYAEIVV